MKVVCSKHTFNGDQEKHKIPHSKYLKEREDAELEIEYYIYFLEM